LFSMNRSLKDKPTGDVILDEALKHIKETQPPENIVSSSIDC